MISHREMLDIIATEAVENYRCVERSILTDKMQINPTRHEMELIVNALDLAASRAGTHEANEMFALRERYLDQMEVYYGTPKRKDANDDGQS